MNAAPRWKRPFDVVVALAGLLVLAPVMLAAAVAIKLDSPGPVLFRQQRVGRGGRLFLIRKFRTMRYEPVPQGAQITVDADPRITRVGAFLRRTKVDELAQLLDVLEGTMSIVGPRPEVPRYVAIYPPALRELLMSVKPGITDPASLLYRDEGTLLAAATDPEREYREVLLPRKLAMSAEYVRGMSFAGDVRILGRTLRLLCFRR